MNRMKIVKEPMHINEDTGRKIKNNQQDVHVTPIFQMTGHLTML